MGSDTDRKYSQLVLEQLHHVGRTLREEGHITLDNENTDCTTAQSRRCNEYPLTNSFHFLVVEDSTRGAAVYSIDKKHNGQRPASIEMAILE